ncbi:MAG: hypothetical protein ACOZAL_02160 [Patescibacteria group bacterium]
MKRKIILLSIAFIVIPLISLAQFDFNLDDLSNTDIDSNITISSFDLIWSTDTYTPDGYQGRALPSPGSKVIVEAIIKTSGGDAKNLKYSWFLEDIFQKSKSGYGKDSFYFYVNQRPGASHIVKLQIFNEDRTVFEEKSIKIPVVEPEIVVYSSNGNSPFSDRATKISAILSNKKFSFIAKPYFFSIKKLTDLNFEWHFANKEVIAPSAYDANVLNITISGKQDQKILENDLWINVTNKSEPRQKAFQIIKVRIQ